VAFNPQEEAEVTLRHQQVFKQLCEMHMVRGFQPVFCADVLDGAAEDIIQRLERMVKTEKLRGGG